MSITVKTTKKTMSALTSLGDHGPMHKKSIRKSFHEIGEIVGRENKRLITTGKKTGRIYNVQGRSHVASAPGEPPASITGALYKSYEYRVASWNTMRVGEGADYAKFLELGTRFMKPRQHLILAINNKSGDAVRIFYTYAKRELKIK